MFKTLFSAIAVTAIVATSPAVAAAPATPADLLTIEALADLAPAIVEVQDEKIETAAYCEWITLYDYWGNWVTYYQCY